MPWPNRPSSWRDARRGEGSLQEVEHFRHATGIVKVSGKHKKQAPADSIALVADDLGLGRVEVTDLTVVLCLRSQPAVLDRQAME